MKTIGKSGVALPIHHTFDREPNSPGWPDQDRKLFGPRESCVHQIATEQQVVLQEQGKDDDRVLASLALVHGYCPRQGDFSEVGVIVGHCALGKLDHDLLLLQVN